MKADSLIHPTEIWAWVVCVSKIYILAILLCLCNVFVAQAQSLPLHHGERVDYDLYFKWGLIMSRAGVATLSVKEATYQNKPSWHYGLLFRTTGVVEKFFKMRDTMECHYSKEPKLLFSAKYSDEGDYYLVDKLWFSYLKDSKVSVKSWRYTLRETKIDTTLISNGLVFDMLGATMFLRSIDWQAVHYGAEFPFVIAVGRDLVNARFRYTGQQIVERKKVKFRTRHFFIDIYDEAFEQAKEAAEVWIGDDANHLPVKIRAKLKIGAAEVYYKDSYNLKVPLDCYMNVR